MTLIPSLRKTSSKAALSLLSRSWIRNRVRSKTPLAEAEVARLLGNPAAGRVRGAAGEVDAAGSELDEEEHVVAAERDRLDGEELTGERARRLLAEELPPPVWSRSDGRM
jgi:hypothetical protein